ncbi:hypothetical protein JTB14_007585 [Gonioctena quinquepunctata]|nr:hypothetical protein JTB14_007585 [Gonioctena quinquepunctata]
MIQCGMQIKQPQNQCKQFPNQKANSNFRTDLEATKSRPSTERKFSNSDDVNNQEILDFLDINLGYEVRNMCSANSPSKLQNRQSDDCPVLCIWFLRRQGPQFSKSAKIVPAPFQDLHRRTFQWIAAIRIWTPSIVLLLVDTLNIQKDEFPARIKKGHR